MRLIYFVIQGETYAVRQAKARCRFVLMLISQDVLYYMFTKTETRCL